LRLSASTYNNRLWRAIHPLRIVSQDARAAELSGCDK
jgi:hypothetical protein